MHAQSIEEFLQCRISEEHALKSPNGDNQLEHVIALRSTSGGELALVLTGCLRMQQEHAWLLM